MWLLVIGLIPHTAIKANAGGSHYVRAKKSIISVNEQLTKPKNKNMRLVMQDLRKYLDNQSVLDGKIDGIRTKAETVFAQNEKLADYLNSSCQELEEQKSELWHLVPFIELSALKTKIQEQVDEELYFISMLDETIKQAASLQKIDTANTGNQKNAALVDKKQSKRKSRKRTRYL